MSHRNSAPVAAIEENTTMKTILVFWKITENQIRQIRAVAAEGGYEVIYETDLQAAAEKADGAEIFYGNDIAPVKAAADPKWFCTYFAGANAYTEEGILPEGCLLSNSAGAYGVTISEHIIMAALNMMRNFIAEYRIGQTDTWSGKDIPMDSLYGSRITVLGTGDIGTTFAERVRSFHPAQIIGVNRSGRKPSEDFDHILTQDRLSNILPETDLLVMSLPETKETIGILDAEKLALLPKTAYIVNVGRGTSIDEAALVRALNNHELAGAALDVMCTEPLPADDPLRSADNILLTPHIAGQMNLAYTKQKNVDMFCEDLENYIHGRPLKYQVDISLGY